MKNEDDTSGGRGGGTCTTIPRETARALLSQGSEGNNMAKPGMSKLKNCYHIL